MATNKTNECIVCGRIAANLIAGESGGELSYKCGADDHLPAFYDGMPRARTARGPGYAARAWFVTTDGVTEVTRVDVNVLDSAGNSHGARSTTVHLNGSGRVDTAAAVLELARFYGERELACVRGGR